MAGLSTGIGSFLALCANKTNTKLLSLALGFSAGVMLYISMIEMFQDAQETLIAQLGTHTGYWLTILGFFSGILLIGVIDKLVPAVENPHEIHTVEEMDGMSVAHKNNLMRLGLFTAVAIAVHNFPEGLATFFSALKDPSLGVATAIAIAIHNIPEGIAISVPIFYATNDKRKAFKWSFYSGLSEPLAALIGYLLLMRFVNDTFFGILFAGVSGIMVYIALDELLPAARAYGEAHLAIYGVVAGMLVMAISLYLFAI
jgi:ZIP family zinc transporter